MTPARGPTVACAIALSLAASVAQAQVQLEAQPVFGEGCVTRSAGTELIMALSNPGSVPVAGTVRVERAGGALVPGVRTLVAAPFALVGGGRATLRLPSPDQAVDAVIEARDGTGRLLAQRVMHFAQPVDAMLVDASTQGRLAYALRAATTLDPLAATIAPSTIATALTGVTPCPALRVPQTGEVVLPRTEAGWRGVAMAVLDAGTLIGLPLAERMALGDYVLAGGTLVIVPERPDELRHPTLAAFVGEGTHGTTPAPLDAATRAWMQLANTAVAGSYPGPETLLEVRSFAGGNLHDRTLAPLLPWGAPELLGASAEYGAGHVHVLSFDPTRTPAVGDPWVLAQIAHLAQSARAERGDRAVDDPGDAIAPPAQVGRMLDPSGGFRPALGLAVVLLVLYAILAGPVAFRVARRRGRAGAALAILPVLSTAFFCAIVAVGGVSRGFQGRARRLTVRDLRAGFVRGPVRRFRGFFSGDAGPIAVTAAGRDHRLYADPGSGRGYVTRLVQHDTSSLEGLVLAAWSTAVVREEAFESLPGDVGLLPDPVGRIRVLNRSHAALRDVVLVAPGGTEGWTFREIADGRSVLAVGQGRPLSASEIAALANSASAPTLPADGASSAASGLPDVFHSDADGAAAWTAAIASMPRAFMAGADAPVLVARRVVAPVAAESGLRVDRDVEFVRVAGWGGAP